MACESALHAALAACSEAIYAYIDQHNPGAARSVKRAIQHTVEILADFPHIGTATDRSSEFRGVVQAAILTVSTTAFVTMRCGSFTSVTRGTSLGTGSEGRIKVLGAPGRNRTSTPCGTRF